MVKGGESDLRCWVQLSQCRVVPPLKFVVFLFRLGKYPKIIWATREKCIKVYLNYMKWDMSVTAALRDGTWQRGCFFFFFKFLSVQLNERGEDHSSPYQGCALRTTRLFCQLYSIWSPPTSNRSHLTVRVLQTCDSVALSDRVCTGSHLHSFASVFYFCCLMVIVKQSPLNKHKCSPSGSNNELHSPRGARIATMEPQKEPWLGFNLTVT